MEENCRLLNQVCSPNMSGGWSTETFNRQVLISKCPLFLSFVSDIAFSRILLEMYFCKLTRLKCFTLNMNDIYDGIQVSVFLLVAYRYFAFVLGPFFGAIICVFICFFSRQIFVDHSLPS